MSNIVEYIKLNKKKLKGEYICVSNVHTTVSATRNSNYMNIQNNAIINLPDGKPLSIIAKFYGHKNIERVTASRFYGGNI